MITLFAIYPKHRLSVSFPIQTLFLSIFLFMTRNLHITYFSASTTFLMLHIRKVFHKFQLAIKFLIKFLRNLAQRISEGYKNGPFFRWDVLKTKLNWLKIFRDTLGFLKGILFSSKEQKLVQQDPVCNLLKVITKTLKLFDRLYSSVEWISIFPSHIIFNKKGESNFCHQDSGFPRCFRENIFSLRRCPRCLLRCKFKFCLVLGKNRIWQFQSDFGIWN